MSKTQGYRIPAGINRTELKVANSRFITTIAPAASTAEARFFLSQIRSEMPDASHHVYAFQIGYGNSVIEGMSDDGEPSGTSGPPTLSVLRGANIGDIVLVTTRYFGGTKLGTGGLVRAYSEAARTALKSLATEEKTPRINVGVEIPYPLYERFKRLITEYAGHIEDETFAGDITVFIALPLTNLTAFSTALRELSGGQVEPLILRDD